MEKVAKNVSNRYMMRECKEANAMSTNSGASYHKTERSVKSSTEQMRHYMICLELSGKAYD
jgi:hypothetical protein